MKTKLIPCQKNIVIRLTQLELEMIIEALQRNTYDELRQKLIRKLLKKFLRNKFSRRA